MADNDPTVLGLLVEGQTRIEAQLTTGLAEFRGEMRGLTSRVEKLERDRVERAAQESAVHSHQERHWSRRDKAWAACGVSLTVAGIWFGPLVAQALGHH